MTEKSEKSGLPEWKVFIERGRKWWPGRPAKSYDEARANALDALREWPEATSVRIMRDFQVFETLDRKKKGGSDERRR